MIIRFTRVSPTHHRFEYIRTDGTSEAVDLETKSFLVHDLLHFALETEAGLSGGFFGLMKAGRNFAQLNSKEPSEYTGGNEIRHIEQAVGALTAVTKGVGPMDAIDALKNIHDAYGEPVPAWLTADTLARAAERYRHLWGNWNSLKFGESLELHFVA